MSTYLLTFAETFTFAVIRCTRSSSGNGAGKSTETTAEQRPAHDPGKRYPASNPILQVGWTSPPALRLGNSNPSRHDSLYALSMMSSLSTNAELRRTCPRLSGHGQMILDTGPRNSGSATAARWATSLNSMINLPTS